MRTKTGATRRQSKNRLFKRAKGFVGGRGRLLRTMKETLLRAGAYAYRDRRVKRREFRRLWITRINGALYTHGLRYSLFIHGLKKANIQLDRKQLSEMAIHDPAGFNAVVAQVKQALAS
jgi:large subunit ribosomal protein L20